MLCLASALLALCCLFGRPGQAQSVAAPPAKVEQLIGLLDDPEVKAWLSQHQQASKPKVETDEEEVADHISTVKSYIRARVAAVAQAVPRSRSRAASGSSASVPGIMWAPGENSGRCCSFTK